MNGLLTEKELFILGQEGMKWIVVSEVYRERFLEYKEENDGVNMDDTMDYLEENLIPYVCVTCEGREAKVYRRYPKGE